LTESAACGQHTVTADGFILADDDGALFIPLERAAEVAEVAATIRDTERFQAARMHMGTSFRSQARLGEYLAARNADASITFRQHLTAFGGEIEE
jgi:regulator of RNase E activity RraA